VVFGVICSLPVTLMHRIRLTSEVLKAAVVRELPLASQRHAYAVFESFRSRVKHPQLTNVNSNIESNL
jgi:hypothetical protein